MNRANLVIPDSKATRNKIARDRRVKAKNASLKNKIVAAINKGDDKSGFIGSFNGGGRLPPFYY